MKIFYVEGVLNGQGIREFFRDLKQFETLSIQLISNNSCSEKKTLLVIPQ